MTTNWYATDLFVTEHIRQLHREAAAAAGRRERFRARHTRLTRILAPMRRPLAGPDLPSARVAGPTGVVRTA